MTWRIFIFGICVLLFSVWFTWMSYHEFWTSWVGSVIVLVGCIIYLPALRDMLSWVRKSNV